MALATASPIWEMDKTGGLRRRLAVTLVGLTIAAAAVQGLSYWAAGHKDLARETWQKGVAANRFSPWGKRCAEMLAIVDAGGVPRR